MITGLKHFRNKEIRETGSKIIKKNINTSYLISENEQKLIFGVMVVDFLVHLTEREKNILKSCVYLPSILSSLKLHFWNNSCI